MSSDLSHTYSVGPYTILQFAYYDKKLEFGSEDPTATERCTRVLTIMAASDY